MLSATKDAPGGWWTDIHLASEPGLRATPLGPLKSARKADSSPIGTSYAPVGEVGSNGSCPT